MDEAGVAKAAIVHSSTAYGFDNSYVADAVAAVPSRFTGVYSIDVLAPDAVKTFDYWLGRGCTGMRLFTTGINAAGSGDVLRRSARLSVLGTCGCEKHSGLHADEAGRSFRFCAQIMDSFPKVTIILDHLARTPFEDGPPYSAAADFFELAKYKQVFLKITPSNWGAKKWGKGDARTFFGKIVDTFGAPRVAWGSNFPNSPGTLEGNPW